MKNVHLGGAATASGDRGAATASGYGGAAAITGEYSTLTVQPNSYGLSTSTRWYWNRVKGAQVACRAGDLLIVLTADEDGLVKVYDGKIVEEWH